MEVIFRPAAEIDLHEAYHWYETRAPGLGTEFMRCVDACVQTICRQPEIYPVTHRQVRQGLLRRFPYSVLYLVSNERIVVISFFHTSRDPKIWKRRL